MNLWAKYADKHKGYCLEFLNDGIFKKAFEVNYDDNIDSIDISNQDTIDSTFYYSKKNEWSNEEEVRIVTPSSIKHPIKIKPELIVSIILGKDLSKENEDKIRNWCNKRTVNIKLFKTEYDAINQKLKRIEI